MLKKLVLVGALLAGTQTVFASSLCVTASLQSLSGTTVTCGTATFDFTNLTFINGNSGFGPEDGTFGAGDGNGGFITAADILVKIYDNPTINFSVTSGSNKWVGDASGSDPNGVGYSTYTIIYDISIQNPYALTQVATTGYNLGFNVSGGEVGVNKDVIYGPDGAYDYGATFDETVQPGPAVIPVATSGLIALLPQTPAAHIIDFVQLTPVTSGGNGYVSMDSFENSFTTPEPGTVLLIGSALIGLGLIRRKKQQQ